MFFNQIACLKLKGCGLVFSDRRVLDAIAIGASGMHLACQKQRRLKADVFEGMITNHSKIGIMGNFAGHIFTVEIEANGTGKVTMDFILARPLCEEELKHTFWAASAMDEKQEKAVFN